MAYVVHPVKSRVFSYHIPSVKAEAGVHPTVTEVLQMDTEQMVARYCKVHPEVDPDALLAILSYKSEHFHWAGADVFPSKTSTGSREMVVLEVNSCPAGQKNTPHGSGTSMDTGYHKLMGGTFLETLKSRCDPDLQNASLAVVMDKNPIELNGYAAALADLTQEPVFYVEAFYSQDEEDRTMRWTDGVMEVKDKEGKWNPIRAAFRYVTKKPWTRLPLVTRTMLFNPIVCCLSGGRNKLVAAKAYSEFNQQLQGTGLHIRCPRTVIGVTKDEIRSVVKALGGKAVVKNPYSHCGLGVYTITSQQELDDLMTSDLEYEKFIVQTLIGHKNWSSSQWHHAGTVPDEDGNTYVFDMRLLVRATSSGFRPLLTFGRRARQPLVDTLDASRSSWDYLGTNLSIKDSMRTTEDRMLSVIPGEFEKLALGVDELIDGFIQAVMAASAIDKMCCTLTLPDGSFDMDKFADLVEDETILQEINSFN